jgi:hypothetical protein
MLKNKNHLLYISYSAIFITLFFFFINNKFGNTLVLNFRLLFSGNEITKVISGLESGSLKENLSTPDDPGFLLLYALASRIDGHQNVTVTSNPENFPLSYKLIYLLIHLGFIFLFVSISEKILTFLTKIIALLFLLSPNLLSIFWGMDVYLFPLYAAIVGFYASGELLEGRLSRTKMFLCIVLVNFCEIFRKKSFLLFLPFMAIFAFKKSPPLKLKAIFFVVFLACSILFNGIVGLVFKKHGHVVWHSLHAGLFEYGGCVGNQGEPYPYFIYEKEDLAKKSLVFCQDTWNDSIQYKIAQQKGIQTLYSQEYNDLLKVQVFEILSDYPTEVLSLIVMRLFNALSFVPIKDHSPAGAITEIVFLNLLESILFLTIFVMWLYKETDKERKWLFLSIFLLTLPAPLLIHSRHIIYNIPLHFIQVLIVGEFLSFYIMKRNRLGIAGTN